MCSTFFDGFMDKIDHISITRIRRSKNSSDLSSGTVPGSIADEFSDLRILVDPLQRCEDNDASHSRYTYWWRHPKATSRLAMAMLRGQVEANPPWGVWRCEVESVICVSDRPKSGSVGRVGPKSIPSRCWVGRSENFDRKPSETV